MLPITDNKLTYDTDLHRYILNHNYFTKVTGTDLNLVLNPGFSIHPENLAENCLAQISYNVYTFIYSFNDNNDIQEYYLATNSYLRENLINVMIQQTLYALRNGDLSMYSSVDIKKNRASEKIAKGIETQIIGINARNELLKIIPDLGVSILYTGKLYYPQNFNYRVGY